MKVVILAGGMGTRLAEVTDVIPKPMVDVGGRPMLWHIMKIYSAHGFNEFVVALGFKGEAIKEYFLDYNHRYTNLSVDLQSGQVNLHDGQKEDWKVDLVDTGLQTQTGGRIKRLKHWLNDETFMLTYGDGVANLDVKELMKFHRSHGKMVTVTAVRPPARFGALRFDGDQVTAFVEKPQLGEGWINGGFFVFESAALDYIKDDETILEREPLERLAEDGQLMAFRHHDFWQGTDTLRDVRLLRSLWDADEAPWKIWTQ